MASGGIDADVDIFGGGNRWWINNKSRMYVLENTGNLCATFHISDQEEEMHFYLTFMYVYICKYISIQLYGYICMYILVMETVFQ